MKTYKDFRNIFILSLLRAFPSFSISTCSILNREEPNIEIALLIPLQIRSLLFDFFILNTADYTLHRWAKHEHRQQNSV